MGKTYKVEEEEEICTNSLALYMFVFDLLVRARQTDEPIEQLAKEAMDTLQSLEG
jgi:hypothetical protein